MRSLLLFLSAALSCLAAGVQDLGDGLGYVRFRDLDQEIPTVTDSSVAIVIDLRGTAGRQPESIARLRAILDVSARRQLRLVLIDPTTSSAVLAALEHRGGSVLTLAPSAMSAPRPDVGVATTLEADRQAREAIDGGKPLAEVLAAKVEKRRYDEAAMVRDHTNGVPIPDSPPELTEAAPSKPGAAKASPEKPQDSTPKTPSLPFDAVLQRSVHLYQALQALKKI